MSGSTSGLRAGVRRFARLVRPGIQDGAVWAELFDGDGGAGRTWAALPGAPWESGEPGARYGVTEPDGSHVGARADAPRRPLEGHRLLAPCMPGKLVLVGQNYRRHAEEMGKPIPAEPLIFLKPPSAVNGPGSPIVLPPESREVHHESELAVIVGERLTRATPGEALAAVFGLTCFNDVTARDIQRRELQHTRAKGFDTFACVGPELVTGVDPSDLEVRCEVDGEVRQRGRTSDMIFPLGELLSFISRAMTLMPGDLVSTGTPSGVGPLREGEEVVVRIEGIGALSNPVVRTMAASDAPSSPDRR